MGMSITRSAKSGTSRAGSDATHHHILMTEDNREIDSVRRMGTNLKRRS